MSRIFSISVCTSTLAEILLGLRILRRNSTSHRVCRGGSRTRILQIPENEKYVQVERGSAECVRTVILTTRELLKAVPLVSVVGPSRDYGSETSVHGTVVVGRKISGRKAGACACRRVCFPAIAYFNAVLRSSGLVVVSVLFVPCVKPLPGAGAVGKTSGRRGFMRANMKNAVGKFDALQYMIVCFNVPRFGTAVYFHAVR